MNYAELLPAIVTAFMAGILGSGHCFGMCGGIAAGLGAFSGSGTGAARLLPPIIFNLGRVISYMLLGALAALLLGGAGEMMHIPGWARLLRVAMAVMILLIGLRFLFNVRWLDPLEKAGSVIWKRIQPFVMRISGKPGISSQVLLGLCWGLIPCGLVYSVLLMAASSASVTEGGMIMLAFGAGTMPSMLGVAWMSPALTVLMRDIWVRRVIGFSLVILAVWTLLMISGM